MRARRLAVRVLAGLLALAASARPAGSSPGAAPRDSAGYLDAVAPYRFRFPRDHAAHPDYRTEWWYVTGRLEGRSGGPAAGRRFGFELTFFRVGLDTSWRRVASAWAPRELILAHLAVTDESGRRFRFAERAARPALGLAGADTARMRVWIGDWSASWARDTLRLRARDGPIGVELALAPRRAPVAHGAAGVSRKSAGAAYASHYYSMTRLAASGSLRWNGHDLPARGVAWMDHEFGSGELAPGQVGWDWLGLRLDDGRDLMLYRLRLAGGGTEPASSGTLVEPDGRARTLPLGTWRIDETARWTSRASGATYPAGWRIVVPSAELDLAVQPTVADQELRTTGSTGVTYWEGSVTVAGRSRGRAVRGEGYVELTGYVGRPPGR